ncbi:uncharacterized protein LOC120424281 isoform X1 [Culex pipiens pallens]|uniref:uncharacterized protein LOC120424281 isoform X1 n=1 Tax=Culex pipiens pallens TaxID=42434 RepID=UPI00195356AF|nr:uncharacterized protein LOC120424281 isoform X1 [Culex pipiens pallens]
MMKVLTATASVLVVLAVLPAITNSDPLRRKRDSEGEVSTVGTVLLDKLLTTTDWDNTLEDDEGSGTITTTVDPVGSSDDSVGISTVIVESKHFGTKNYTFLEPNHIPISDFLDMDEDMDLELLFTEVVNADFQQGGGTSPAQNIMLQIEDYDDEGNTQSYFLHSSPHSEETHGNGTTAQSDRFTSPDVSSRVSGFFRDVLQRLGVYKYIVDYQNEQNQGGGQGGGGSKVPHRFHPHLINTPKGLRNIPAHFGDQFQPSETTPGSPSLTSSSKRPRPGAVPPRSSIGNLFNQFKQRIKAIYPGTVWCGDGNQAKSENDIGFFHLTDTCCRAHDLCPVSIAAGEQFNRLKNNGYFTRSHCDCDKAFYNCLKNADTLVSNQIGYTYFNLLKPQCFRHEYPKVACTKKSKGKCLTYVVDETKDKLWQWFDNLIY